MASGTDSGILQAALEYAALGWRIVPLHNPVQGGGCSCKRPECESIGKHPRIKEWQKAASKSAEEIAEWWGRWPDANIGIAFGEGSGLIEIETDSVEEEKLLWELFGGQPPPTATFRSGRKAGKHWLFRWRADLPAVGVAHYGTLRIAIGNGNKGAQSVFPPSMHHTGTRYHWGASPKDVPVAALPDSVVTKLFNSPEGPGDGKPKLWRQVFDKDRIVKGDDKQHDTLMSFACREAARSPNIDDPDEQIDLYQKLTWASKIKFDPEARPEAIKEIHQAAIAYTRRDRGGTGAIEAFTVHGLKYDRGLWLPGEWKLTIVKSDPVTYKLFVLRWKELMSDGNGIIPLTLKQYRDAEAVACAIEEATGGEVTLDDVPRVWPSIWNGRPGNKKEGIAPRRGLKAILKDTADREIPPSVRKRTVVVGEVFSDLLARARVCGEKEEPDSKRPIIMPDGTIWLRWLALWKEPLLNREVAQSEVEEFSRRLGLRKSDFKLWPSSGEKRMRYLLFTKEHRAKLESLIEDEPPQSNAK